MRFLLCLIMAAGLVGCDSGSVPSPADRQAGSGEAEPVNEELIALHGEGLVVGAEAFYFAAGRSEVESALEQRLGDSTQRADLTECGVGPIESVAYPGGLTVNFQQGSLAGWTLKGRSDAIQVDAPLAIGTPDDAAQAVSAYAPIGDSTLGEEFALGDRMGGFIQNGEVAVLYAGAQCFARVPGRR